MMTMTQTEVIDLLNSVHMNGDIHAFNERVRKFWMAETRHNTALRTVRDPEFADAFPGAGRNWPHFTMASAMQQRDIDVPELASPRDVHELLFKSVTKEQIPDMLHELEQSVETMLHEYTDRLPGGTGIVYMCFAPVTDIRREAYQLKWYTWLHYVPLWIPPRP
jgi:hypothetical protein